jgi:phosphoglucosamine mutase
LTLRFGTDGIRGVAGSDLTPELIRRLGRAAAEVLGGPRILIGRDTRESGPWIQAALSAGMISEGVDVIDVGVLPTPAVADLARAQGVAAAVISASHNPYTDNGIKLLSAGGRKLTDAEEEAVERALVADPMPETARPGVVRGDPASSVHYEEVVIGALEGRRLDGLRVVVDCANGAAYRTGPQLLEAAGAVLAEVLAAGPDGANINRDCGSTHPSLVAEAVVRHGAAAGLAFDGDADRVIAVDEKGAVVDGDRLIALFALDLRARGLLAGSGVAVTVMTNLGFHRAMADASVEVVTTAVGDRHIVDALETNGWSLGGEQSGHIVFREVWPHLAPTGDGVLTGLVLLDLLQRSGRSLSELASGVMVAMPQVLRNVKVADHRALPGADAVWAEVRTVEGNLGDQGRVLIRPSGTEALVRVMVEAPTEDQALAAVDRLSTVVVQALGAPA